jgi:hypothetical protein
LSDTDQADRHAVDLEILGDRRELRGRHQAAGADQHEHRVHDPEDRRANHFPGCVVARGLLQAGLRRRGLALDRRTQKQRHHDDDDALRDTEPQEGRLVAPRSAATRRRQGKARDQYGISLKAQRRADQRNLRGVAEGQE